jgi:hypothetical protein
MIIGSIYQGIKDFSFSRSQSSFIIYDNSALGASDQAELDDLALLKFDGIANVEYENDILMPRQSLENRQFSNDSIIDNPFVLSLTGVVSNAIFSEDDKTQDKNNNVENNLNYIAKTDILVVIFRTFPLFRDYPNMHLTSWNYKQTPDNVGFFANLKFTEVRSSYVPTPNIKSSNINNSQSFSDSNSKSPTASSSVDNGFVGSSSPSGDTSNLGIFGG